MRTCQKRFRPKNNNSHVLLILRSKNLRTTCVQLTAFVGTPLPEGRRCPIPGEKAFQLYDTYGLPLDFILDSARDLGIPVDEEGFDRAMQEQKTRARASWKGAHKETANPAYAKIAETFKTEKDFYHATSSAKTFESKRSLVRMVPSTN